MAQLTTQEQENARLSSIYSRICLMAYPMIDAIDELRESTDPMHQLKFHLKGVEREIKKITAKHAEKIIKYATFTDSRGITHKGEDMLMSSIDAYKEIFSRPETQVFGISEMIRQAEAKGIDFEKIDVNYEPLKN